MLTQSPLFGIFLTLISYIIGMEINRKFKKSYLNPILISIIIVVSVLSIFKIPTESYFVGGDIITLFLGPVTAVLALSVYRERKLLKKHFLAIIIGTAIGSLASVGSIILLCKFLKIDDVIIASLIPKSITTPIAIAVSTSLGGIPAITVIAVIITGISGSVFAPCFVTMFKIKHPVAKGVAIGTSSHALGTIKAIEMGEDIGAMSGISIAFSGFFTVIFALLFF
jgi:predicted murein hydrolase (TIGR00659 family)